MLCIINALRPFLLVAAAYDQTVVSRDQQAQLHQGLRRYQSDVPLRSA